MLGQCCRRWAIIETTLVQRFLLAGRLHKLHERMNERKKSSFNREYMAWDTPIKSKYCRWNGDHPFDSSVIVFYQVQYACEMIQYIQCERQNAVCLSSFMKNTIIRGIIWNITSS